MHLDLADDGVGRRQFVELGNDALPLSPLAPRHVGGRASVAPPCHAPDSQQL